MTTARIRASFPVAPAEVARHSKTLALAMNLRPFSGIAFLWFMGAVRNRLGKLEDQFFATVFLGSSLLYVAMMFINRAVASAAIGIIAFGQTCPQPRVRTTWLG